MKKIFYVILPLTMIACGAEESTENEETTDSTVEEVVETEGTEEVKKPKSPKITEEWMGEVNVNMDYSSPRVKDRVIWGELVPYDKVWRAGANEVTMINFQDDASIAGETVASGSYGLFIIPKEEGDWTFILNEEWSKDEHDVWGSSNYKEEKDVLRFDVSPTWMEESIEEMSFEMIDGMLVFEWEKVHLEFNIEKAN